MRVTYVHHSCYALETPGALLIADFYKDAATEEFPGGIARTLAAESKKSVYILASHAHHDHFNKEVLLWKKSRPDIRCVFSADILSARLAKKDDAVFLEKFSEYSDGEVFIKAFGSTDEGVSFFISAGGKNVFHAGDLNNWRWENESTKSEISQANLAYLAELDDIAAYGKRLDLALLPIDPRQGAGYMLGAEQFVEKIPTAAVAPMHFWQNYSAANAFGPVALARGVKFFPVTHKAQTFEL